MREFWLANVIALSGVVAALSACSIEKRDFGVIGNGATSAGGSGTQESGTSTGGAGRQDSGSNNDAGNSDTIKPKIAVKPDLVGFATQLDGSGSTGPSGEPLSYQWTIIGVPAGSDITTSSLSSGSATSPTFEPDLGGDYRIRLTVSGEGLSNSTEITFVVPVIDVAYLNVAGDTSSYTRAGAMVKSDGQLNRNVGCYFSNSATSEAIWIDTFLHEGQFNLRGYYPQNIDSPTLIAYSYADNSTGAMHLQVAGPTSNCTGNPPLTTTGGTFPLFSPNGQRISLIAPVPGNSGHSVFTVGIDGNNPRVIRTSTTGGLDSSSGITWIDDSHIAWAEVESDASQSTGWNVVYASADADGAFTNNLLTTKVLNCKGAANPLPPFNRLAISDGVLFLTDSVFASLWRLEPTNGAYLCDTTAPQNKPVVAGAFNFELSPDGSRIIFDSTGTVVGNVVLTASIFVGPSNGVSGDFVPLVAADDSANIGAHWVAGGRQIVWTKIFQEYLDAGTTSHYRPKDSSVWIMNADGSSPRQLVAISSTPAQARTVNTGGNGCSIQKSGVQQGFPWILGASTVGLLGLRRSRRRRRINGDAQSTLLRHHPGES